MLLLIVIKINKTWGTKPAKTKELILNTVAHCLLSDAQPLSEQQSIPSR